MVSKDEEEDLGLSLSPNKVEEATGAPLEEAVAKGLLSASLSLSRSLSRFKLRVRSSMGPLLAPSALV